MILKHIFPQWKAVIAQGSNVQENVTIWWFTSTTFISSTLPHCQRMTVDSPTVAAINELFCLAQNFVWITCAWVLPGSLQEQHHGPQRPGTLAASAAQDKLHGWFYGVESEGKACSLSVQGLQWPFLGLSAVVNKYRIILHENEMKIRQSSAP